MPIHFEEPLRHETHTSTISWQRLGLLSPKMSLQPLFMKLIHLLNYIYSDRICHILSISWALLLNIVSQWVCANTYGLTKFRISPICLHNSWNIATGVLRFFLLLRETLLEARTVCHRSPLKSTLVIADIQLCVFVLIETRLRERNQMEYFSSIDKSALWQPPS